MNPSHPSELLEIYAQAVGRPFYFEFSKYVYIPQSINDDRETLRVSAAEAKGKAEILLTTLKPGQELAIHSTLTAAGDLSFHIPMMDLAASCEDLDPGQFSDWLREFGIREFALFKTGRSAHIYGLQLLSTLELLRFFGRALLLNMPGRPPVVDARWIGHRVMGGFGSLRWSCNSSQYLQAPELIGRYKT